MSDFEDFLATGAATSLGGGIGGLLGVVIGTVLASGLTKAVNMRGAAREQAVILSMWVFGLIGALAGAYSGYSSVQDSPSPSL